MLLGYHSVKFGQHTNWIKVTFLDSPGSIDYRYVFGFCRSSGCLLTKICQTTGGLVTCQQSWNHPPPKDHRVVIQNKCRSQLIEILLFGVADFLSSLAVNKGWRLWTTTCHINNEDPCRSSLWGPMRHPGIDRERAQNCAPLTYFLQWASLSSLLQPWID